MSAYQRDYQRMILDSAFDALKQEYNRIKNLLDPTTKSPLGKECILHLRDNFSDAITDMEDALARIEQAIDRGDYAAGWQEYVALKAGLLPVLAGELLAVIGGFSLSEKRLDTIDPNQDTGETERDPADAKPEALQFSVMADKLVKDLDDRSHLGWKSVIIVGEERLSYNESQVIRMRYPSCGFWELPLTAHEYAYICAHLPSRHIEAFSKLCASVREQAGFKGVVRGSPPEDIDCYLPRLQELSQRYHDLQVTNDQCEQFLAAHSVELKRLVLRQESHLCRLFADAFATLFVGPAYIHALLNLYFLPESCCDSLSPDLPPLDQRLLFAIETLRWMDSVDPANLGGFKRELDDAFPSPISQGLLMLWFQAVLSSDPGHDRTEDDLRSSYNALKQRFNPWLTTFQESLRGFARTAGRDTLNNWRDAQALVGRDKDSCPMLSSNLSVDERPHPWVTLNAAWTARWLYPEQSKTIYMNALRLLDESNKEVVRQGPRGEASAGQNIQRQVRQQVSGATDRAPRSGSDTGGAGRQDEYSSTRDQLAQVLYQLPEQDVIDELFEAVDRYHKDGVGLYELRVLLRNRILDDALCARALDLLKRLVNTRNVLPSEVVGGL